MAVEIYSDVDKYHAQAFNLTGPEALDHYEVARLLSEVRNEEIKYVAISGEEMKKASIENGLPEEHADMLLALYNATAAGYTAAITDDVKTVTGKNPLTLKEVLRKN